MRTREEAEVEMKVDPSCLGERALSYGVPNGWVESGGTTQKVGHEYSALLLTAQGFTSGRPFFEVVDCCGEGVGWRIGCVPRAASQGLDLDTDLPDNGGHGLRLLSGKDTIYGDRIGCMLDFAQSQLLFFKNGQFLHTPIKIKCPERVPMFFAVACAGKANVAAGFSVVPRPPTPDLAAYWAAVPHVQNVDIAFAHTGATVELSSALQEDVRLSVGDALLFVDVGRPASADRWAFRIEEESVVAQDPFYAHVELDLHGSRDPVQLKHAFKFIALSPGTTIFKSGYGLPGKQEWVQKIKVTVA